MDIKAWAEQKFSKVRYASASEINVPCPFCSEDETKRGRLYINIDPNMDPLGLFHCKLCDERGAINKLLKHFGEPTLKSDEKFSYDTTRPKVLRDTAEYYYQCGLKNSDVVDYYRYVRNLTDETIKEHKLGFGGPGLVDYLKSQGNSFADILKAGFVNESGKEVLTGFLTIPYHAGGNVISIRGRAFVDDNGPKYKTIKGDKAFLFNSAVTWGRPEELVICEGEFDALSLTQLGIAAVGIPGAGNWQDSWNGYVSPEAVSRLYICFDEDETGYKSAEKLADKLSGRAKVIHLLPDMPDSDDPKSGFDISEWINQGGTKDEFKELMRRSKGGLLISVREAFENWKQVEGNPNLKGLKFGIPMLDEAIKPGILPAQVVMTLAKTGAGKTISMLNFLHRMKREQPEKKFLFLSLEQTSNEWYERARRIHKFYEPSATHEDTIRFWEDNMMIVDKNALTQDEVQSLIQQFKYEKGACDLVALDYLGYYARSAPGRGPYEKTSSAIMGLKGLGKEEKVAIYVPHQVSRLNEPGKEPEMNNARDSGVTEETADFVFALWAPDQKPGLEIHQRTGEVSMKILKSRHGGLNTRVDMLFTPKTLAMIPQDDQLYYVAEKELKLARVGDDLDAVIYRNLTGWDGALVTPEVRNDIARLKAEGYM